MAEQRVVKCRAGIVIEWFLIESCGYYHQASMGGCERWKSFRYMLFIVED